MGRLTYDSEDERVGEVSVEGQLHRVPPQLQGLDGLCQADEYVHGSQGEHSSNTTYTHTPTTLTLPAELVHQDQTCYTIW